MAAHQTHCNVSSWVEYHFLVIGESCQNSCNFIEFTILSCYAVRAVMTETLELAPVITFCREEFAVLP